MKTLPFRCALLTAGLFCGCSTTSTTFTALNSPPHRLYRRVPEQIQVFSSAPPERPHVDVGLITVEEGEIGGGTPAELIGMIRQAAAERGCDAVVLAPPGSKSESPSVFVDRTNSYRVYSGTCVVYRRVPRQEAETATEP